MKQVVWFTWLCYTFYKVFRTHSKIFCIYRCDGRQHIHEGIYLSAAVPVTVRVDLAKNITVRSG